MKIEFDPHKNQRNILERGISFEQVGLLKWKTALIWQDTRFLYPEPRFSGLAYLDERLFAICFTPIKDGIRVISFRKANKREIKKYEQQTATATTHSF